RPFINGDYDFDQGPGSHILGSPHTDLFYPGDAGSDSFIGIIDITATTAVTKLNLLDGRSFKFRYNQYGEVAEIVYPAGGVCRVDYTAFTASICEGGANILNPILNRRVTQRRNMKDDGITVDAVWNYTWGTGSVGATTYPTTTLEVRKGSDN